MPVVTVVVDAANVVGSRPDGWWRDRPGAAARLYANVARTAGSPVDVTGPAAAAGWVVVLEGAARRAEIPGDVLVASAGVLAGGVPPGTVRVLLAPGSGPGSGDDAIVEVVRELPGERMVVTADRELRRRCESAGAPATGPGWLLARFPP